MSIKPFYTIEQIRQMIGYSSRNGTKAILDRMNIPCHHLGKKVIYYLVEIQTYAPLFFSSVFEAQNLNELFEVQNKSNIEQKKEPEELENITKEQLK